MNTKDYEALLSQYPRLTLHRLGGSDLDRAELFDPENIKILNTANKYIEFVLPHWQHEVGVNDFARRIKSWANIKKEPPIGIVILSAYVNRCVVRELSYNDDNFYRYGRVSLSPPNKKEEFPL